MCKLFKETPELMRSPENLGTAVCCDVRWNITEDMAICGRNFNGLVIPCLVDESFWTWDHGSGIYIDIVILCIDFVLFWSILIFTETNILKKIYIWLQELLYGSKVAPEENLDADVQQEKDSIYENPNMMRVINLSKKFGKFDAVRGLTFGVRKKECFGLLGINGAGKTTTFRFHLYILSLKHN